MFVAGLMVGRTSEYRGKKIEAREDQTGAARAPCLSGIAVWLRGYGGGIAARA
ncbi:hypothetical protein GGQ85_003122 [Nitrobacter vulgaris]|nr:potassium-transporting ATPase subunit KdpA [Nitrobacter vulgaris]MDR6305400.1 hypothetical protein [Nitrobacter vulgaris]